MTQVSVAARALDYCESEFTHRWVARLPEGYCGAKRSGRIAAFGPSGGLGATRALLEKADRLLPKIAAEDRAEVERLLGNVRNALTDRQWDKVTQACNELSDILFYLEDV